VGWSGLRCWQAAREDDGLIISLVCSRTEAAERWAGLVFDVGRPRGKVMD
jgi:hypothetical protein